MKLFNSTVNFDSNNYVFKKIDFNNLMEKKTPKEKLEAINQMLDFEFENLKSISGVYLFVLNKDFIVPSNFFSQTKMYIKVGDNEYKDANYDISSPITENFPHDNVLKKGYLLYVGMKQSDLINRIFDHLTNDKVDGNRSLKLGFQSRKTIVEYLDCYALFIEKDSASSLESQIRNKFGTYFGE